MTRSSFYVRLVPWSNPSLDCDGFSGVLRGIFTSVDRLLLHELSNYHQKILDFVSGIPRTPLSFIAFEFVKALLRYPPSWNAGNKEWIS